MYVYVYKHACVCVCLSVYLCAFVCVHVSVYICIYVCLYVCVCTHMYVYVFVSVSVVCQIQNLHLWYVCQMSHKVQKVWKWYLDLSVCVWACMWLYVHVFLCIYICVYVCQLSNLYLCQIYQMSQKVQNWKFLKIYNFKNIVHGCIISSLYPQYRCITEPNMKTLSLTM